MMRLTTACGLAVLLAYAELATAFDCDQVKAMHAEGKRPADIARELAITTPDVQSCLAGEIEEQRPPREQASGLPIKPQMPGADAPIPRPPHE